MIWDVILGNFIEASVELEELRDRILICLKPNAEKSRREFIEFSFFYIDGTCLSPRQSCVELSTSR